MALRIVSSGLLLLCAVTCALRDSKNALQQSFTLPQVPIEVECKANSLFISLDVSSSGSQPRFEAVDATGAYPVTESYGIQCGYTYSVLWERVAFRASYFSCHTDNQNDEIFTFMFGVFTMDQLGQESFFNVSKTCSVPPFSPRVVTCEENYVEVSVKTDLPCPTAGSVKDLSTGLYVGYSSTVEAWQVMLQREGQQPEIMSTEDAAAQGYFIMVTPGRLVFRTTFGQPHSSLKMVNGVTVEVIKATVFFRENWMVVIVDLLAAYSLDEGIFDGYRLHWRTPAVMTPLAVGTSELSSEYIGMGVDGDILDGQVAADRGYSVVVSDGTIDCSIPFAAEGGIRKSFVADNVYNVLYAVQLTYQQVFVDQRSVKTEYNVVRQMVTPPIPYPPFSLNQTNPEERVFTVYLGNIPFDVDLVSVELNGHEISVLSATQMGYSITRVSEGNITFAYIIRVPFDDQFVVKQYISESFFEYYLEIKWTLYIMPQMDAYYHFSSVAALVHEVHDAPIVFPPVFDSICADGGISFKKDHNETDYLWDITIGSYKLTPQLASDRGYILTNDSNTLTLDVPLFTIGYVYENITLQQFYGTFELLDRNVVTLKIDQSSAKRCLFQTTELLGSVAAPNFIQIYGIVCSTEGVMTVVSDITKAVPSADPARTTLLDTNCRPQDTDGSRVLFSFGLNTCGTRFQVTQQYVIYENEIILHELYSTDSRPVITRDAAYRMTVRCIYPLSGIESLLVDRRFRAETPGIGQIKDPVKVPSQMQQQKQPVQQQKQPVQQQKQPVQQQKQPVQQQKQPVQQQKQPVQQQKQPFQAFDSRKPAVFVRVG